MPFLNYFFLLLLSFLVLLHPSKSVAGENKKALTVGAVLSLTGMAALQGSSIQDGLEFAKSELAKDGWKIDIIYEDDGTEPKRTIAAVESLIHRDIKLIIGPIWEILATPASPIIKRANAVSFQPSNSSDFVFGANDRNFFFLARPSLALEPLTAALKTKDAKRIAIVNNDSSWGQLWKRIFEAAAKDADAKIISTHFFQFSDGTSGIPPLLSKLKGQKIDTILSTGSNDFVSMLVKGAETQKFKLTMIGPEFLDAQLDGLLPKESQFVEAESILPKASPEFIEAFTKWKGTAPKKYTDFAHNTLFALTKAVDEVGNDPDAIKNYLETKLDETIFGNRLRLNAAHDVEGVGYEVTEVIKLK